MLYPKNTNLKRRKEYNQAHLLLGIIQFTYKQTENMNEVSLIKQLFNLTFKNNELKTSSIYDMRKIYLFVLICTLIACQEDISEDIELNLLQNLINKKRLCWMAWKSRSISEK